MSPDVTEVALKAYTKQLIQRGPFGQFLAPDVTLTVMGSNMAVQGARAVEQFIRFLHEQAFDAQPELKSTLVADERAALEFVFIGTHIGEFMGVAATGRQVRVPYSVFYAFADGKITALCVYMPMGALMRQLCQPAA